MPVLGKRTRRSGAQMAASPPPPIFTRSKRAAVDSTKTFIIASDEEDNPFITTRGAKRKRATQQSLDHDDDPFIENTPPAKRVARAMDDDDMDLDSVQPAKTTKLDQDLTPRTPRHRDSLAKKVAITPRHRIGLMNRPATPQSLQSPATPRVLFPTVYNDARKLFRTSVQSSSVIGREKERDDIKSFISKRFDAKKSGCIYVSGPPGTGKSALITEILKNLDDEYSVKTSYCNCMSIKTAEDIYAKLFDEFGVADVLQGTEMNELKKVFHDRKSSRLVILDEIDHLLDVDFELLHQLFEWSLQKTSSLVLIGIANALDLTDRFLPRLKSKNMKPHLVSFLPYSVEDVKSIITEKLKSLLPAQTADSVEHIPFIHPTAIQFLAKKVAVQTGDLRKAFAICLRAIDLVEGETQATMNASMQQLTPSETPTPTKTPLRENSFLSSPSKSPAKARSPKKSSHANPMAALTAVTAPRATIAHMARVTATAFSNGVTQRLISLNLQQKAALCALSALERTRQSTDTPGKSSAPTLRALHDAYTRLCKREDVLHPLSASEFHDVVASLENASLVSWVDGTAGSLAVGTPSRRGRGKVLENGNESQKVASVVGMKELKASLSGVGSGILLSIVEGEPL